MKKIVNLLKSVVFLVIVALFCFMGYLNREMIWQQTKMARAFYFVWQGDESIKANNFQAAIDNYKTALKIYPEHPKAHYNLGNIYFWYEVYTASPVKQPVKTYRYDKDLDKFVLHIEEPTNVEDTENNAEAAYIRATEVQPNYINAWINLGLVRLQKYDLDGAIRAFMNAINANPTIVDIPLIFNNEGSLQHNKSVAYYNLGYVYNQMAESCDYKELRESYYVEALRYYKKALELNPNSYKNLYNLAHTYQMLTRYNSAIQEYCKAIKFKPFDYPPHYNLGVILNDQKRYTASASELKKAAMLVDTGKDSVKAEYIFRILNEVSFKSAAKELSAIEHENETTYPIPKEGIIAEVIGKPILEKQKELEIKKQEQAQQLQQEDESTSLDAVTKYFSACVTDPNYFEVQKEKFSVHPNWIYVNKEMLVPETAADFEL